MHTREWWNANDTPSFSVSSDPSCFCVLVYTVLPVAILFSSLNYQGFLVRKLHSVQRSNLPSTMEVWSCWWSVNPAAIRMIYPLISHEWCFRFAVPCNLINFPMFIPGPEIHFQMLPCIPTWLCSSAQEFV